MKDGHYISIICKTREGAENNYYALHESLPGVGIVEGQFGNELIICCSDGNSRPCYSLNQIRDALKGPVRVDMFEFITDEKSGQQYRNWYYLPPKRIQRKTT